MVDVAEAIFDGPHATPKLTPDGPVFLGISSLVNGHLDLSQSGHVSEEDFKKWTRRVQPRADDLVFSYETRLGEAALIPPGLVCCLGRRMALVRPNLETVDPKFLLYAYLGPQFQEVIRQRTVHGSTVSRIPLVEFPSFEIDVPPLLEQRAIAEVLGAIDDKIDSNKRITLLVDKFLKAEVEHATDIDPEARTCTFGDLVDRINVGVNPDNLEKAVPYIGLEHMPRGSIILDEWGDSQGLGSGKALFEEGDILFGKLRPYFKKVGVAPLNGVCSTDILVLRPRVDAPLSIALAIAASDQLIDYASAASTGTRMPRVSWEYLAEFETEVPGPNMTMTLSDRLEPLLALATELTTQNRTLAAMRDALLPELLSGRIRTPVASELVGSL